MEWTQKKPISPALILEAQGDWKRQEFKEEFEDLVRATSEKEANVFVAYNRRFYASVLKAQEIIEEDGGVTSFNFE